jgi:ferrous iron transport protein A
MAPLGLLGTGERAEVLEVRRGLCIKGKDPLECRLEDLGVRPGNKVEVLNNEGKGPLLVKIDESRIAIGRGMAMKILVRKID